MPKLRDPILTIVDNRGKNPPYYATSGIPVIDNYLITNNYYPDLSAVNRFIDDNLLVNFIRCKSEKDDVLVTLVGNGLGNICICPENTVIIQNTIGLRFDKNKALQKYMYYQLLTKNKEMRGLNRGASQPSAKVSDLLDLEIKLDTLEEQRHIVNTISSLLLKSL